MSTDTTATAVEGKDFIRAIIDEDLEQGTYDGRVVTRFPPEPNGYLHIGHAKSICLNFGLAEEYGGRCHLRFDDTNPATESEEFARSIEEAVHWLGFDWGDHLYYASDYFEPFYEYAVKLIEQGKAYVDSLSEEEIREYRGTVTEPGRPSPYRDRSVKENLDLFERMRAGEFEDGEHVLRAKIDMSSPHMILRDPLLYRIRHFEHYRRGDEWCIYPMYDYAHPLEDALEDVTHSLCTLEFDNNRRVYDWVLDNALEPDEQEGRPHQYEFSRLNLGYTVMSKRKLRQLVEEDYVDGWDDPRLPTLAGLRRRGVTPSAIRTFCDRIGITRSESRVEISQFEHALRDDLNYEAPRVMAVLDPLKVTITNFAEDETDWIEAPHWPHEIDREGMRRVPFTREIYIERSDFREDPPAGFYRLAPGREVRLRYGYFLTCEDVIRNEDGEVVELRGRIDPETRGGDAPDGRSPAGTLHWVSARHALPIEARLYDRLFDVPAPDEGEEDFTTHLNPESLVMQKGFAEPSVADQPSDQRLQFERQGYFWQDPEDSSPEALVFNRIISLRDTWAEKEQERERIQQEERRRRKEARKEEQRQRALAGQRDPAEDFDNAQRARFERYRDEMGVDRDDAATLAEDAAVGRFFERALSTGEDPQAVANWIVNELLRELKGRPIEELPFTANQFGQLVALSHEDEISSRAAKKVFDEMLATGQDPEQIVEKRELRQIDDASALGPLVDEIVAAHPDEAGRYRGGKKGLIGFFMGQVMQQSRGKANPELARQLLQDRLQDDEGADRG